MDFPRTADQLTSAWLEASLREAGVLGDGRVRAHRATPVDEQGQTGDVVKVTVDYEGDAAGAPSSLVVKFATPYAETRAQMHGLGLYEPEVRFYQEFGKEPGIPVPGCYGAHIDTETGDFALLLEDMSTCRAGDFWDFPVADAELAVRHLAGLHARWWQNPRIFESGWLRQPDDKAFYVDQLRPLLEFSTPICEQKYGDRFSGILRDAAYHLLENWEAFWTPRGHERYTLVHADFHPKQLFFPGEQGGRFAAFDWQTVSVGIGALDLSRILCAGMLPADLREHQQRLIELYHSLLIEHGVDPGPLDELVKETRRAMLYSLHIGVFALGMTDVEILRQAGLARGIEVERRMFDDFAENLEFNDVLSLL